ncbi:MAG: hypothetical protein V4640_15835 [Verrucomicrobiota bacterium]
MKLPIQFAAITFLFSGCASHTASTDILSVYTDNSPSPVTWEQACEIAKREAKARDSFLDEPRIPNKQSKLILVTANRINNGGWRAIVRSAVSDNRPDAGGGAAYLNVPAAVVTIEASARVASYARYSNDQIYKAEQAVAPNRSLLPGLNSTSSVRGSED